MSVDEFPQNVNDFAYLFTRRADNIYQKTSGADLREVNKGLCYNSSFGVQKRQ
jgi:hypothetical protein